MSRTYPKKKTYIQPAIIKMAPIDNIIRLAKWFKLDIDNKTSEEIVEMVCQVINKSDKHFYVHGL